MNCASMMRINLGEVNRSRGRCRERRCIRIGGSAAACVAVSGAGWWWGLAVVGVLVWGGVLSAPPPPGQANWARARGGGVGTSRCNGPSSGGRVGSAPSPGASPPSVLVF